ncbi:MAG: glycosidase, partial [Nitrososphaerota archaeon]|nr:glycosidase [Nitrososphaerota archaeon]
FYHGVSHDNVYRIGAILLDLKSPENIIARTSRAILEPSTVYEKEGYTRNVVFPCGAVVRGDTIYLYYGAADYSVCVATASLKKILSILI